MAEQSALVARLLAQRESWLDLGAGKRIRVRRPGEADMGRFSRGVALDDAAACCVAWDGFSEASILGPSLGSDKPIPFDAAVWLELLRDNIDWLDLVVAKLFELVRSHLDAREAVRGNSRPSSTPGPESSTRASDQPSPDPTT